MFNTRKRMAQDPLLPTRQPKHPRVEESSCSAPDAQATARSSLTARWSQIARELYELTTETIKALGSPPSPPPALPPHLRRLSLPPSTRPHSPSPPLRPTIPNEFHTYEHQIQAEQTSLSSSLSSHQYSTQTLPNPAHASSSSLQLTSTTGLTSFSRSNVEPHDQTGDGLLVDAVQQRRKIEEMYHVLNRRRSKEHIFSRMHKAKVREDRIKDREAVMKELFDLKRASGFKSNYQDFKSFIDYQARLQHLDDRDILSPSASLTDLRLKGDTPSLPHRHSFSDYADVPFLENAKNKLLRTLASPPTKPFSAYEWLRQEARKKDEEIEQRFRPSLPKALPPDIDRQVDLLLAKKGVISKIAREQVCDKDLSRLLPCQWLNDELINFYGAMILERSEACKENPATNGRKNPLNVHYFNTFFWSKLQGEGYERARLAKWTKKFDIFSKDVVLIPINHNNSHWTGAAINFRRKRIESYDSMNLDRHHVFKSLRQYLDLECQNKKKRPFDFTGWVNHCPDVSRVPCAHYPRILMSLQQDTPQQENGYDCGVFTCQFVEALSRGEETFNFSQRDMPYLRRRMIWEIAHARFLDAS
ncbi:cysteine proteinase [Chiua virens]|nr:cysteine proteinase [Chiua virens]